MPAHVLVPQLEASGRIETRQEGLATHEGPLLRCARRVHLVRVERAVEESVVQTPDLCSQLVHLSPSVLDTRTTCDES